MNPLVIIAASCCAAVVTATPLPAANPTYATLIVGAWQGPRHVRAFYGSGDFTLDPEPEGRPLGSWRIVGDRLTIRLPGHRTETTERIVRLTKTEMVVEAAGKNYSYKRVIHW